MSLAAETREAVRRRPTLYDALQAGVINYTAAAAVLDIDGDNEAIATALRRFAESLSSAETDDTADRSVTVRMQSGIAPVADVESLLAVDGVRFDGDSSSPQSAADADSGPLTAIHATGDVDGELLATVLDRLRTATIAIRGAGVADTALVVIVPRSAGAQALRAVEAVV